MEEIDRNIRNQKIIELAKEGRSIKEIAALYNLTKMKVWFILKANYQKYSEEFLLNYLKELAVQLGKTPSSKDIVDAGKLNASLFIMRFGSIGKAQIAAGLVPFKRKYLQKYSDEYLLNHLKELAEQLGRTPTMLDVNKYGKVSFTPYVKRFGKLSVALKAAGLVLNKHGSILKYSDEFLLNHLKELAVKLGRTPSKQDVDEAGIVGSFIYNQHFGGFIKAQKAAGLESSINNRKKKYSDEYLLNHLKELTVKLGRTPTHQDIDEAGKVGSAIYNRRFGGIVKAQKAAGLVPNDKYSLRKYSDEYLLNHLKELAEQLGRTPTLKDIDEAGKCSSGTYHVRFGSFKMAQKAAGLPPSGRKYIRKYSDEFLLNYLKELAVQLGRTPSGNDIIDAGKLSASPFAKRFGSIVKAQIAAGLVPNLKANYQKYSDEYLLNYLKELAEKLGRTPSSKDLTEKGKVNYGTYIYRFGSVNKALIAAGLVPNDKNNLRKYSDEYLLNHLKELAEQLGRTPSQLDIDKYGKVCSATYHVRFGSLSIAQKAAGLVINIKGSIIKYSDEFLLNHLKELAKQLGRTPSNNDIINAGKLSATIFAKRFGSILKAQIAAGLVPNDKENLGKYSDEYLLNHLRELAEQLGKTPAMRDIIKDGKVSAAPYLRRFGKLSVAQKAAGLVPNNNTDMKKYSDEFLLNHLKELAEQLGKTPSATYINKYGKVKARTYMSRFGNLRNAQKVAGLVPNDKDSLRKYSNEYLLNHLKELAEQLGKTPTQQDVNKAGKVGSIIYIRRFGGITKAQKTAGLVSNKQGNIFKYSNEYLLNHLKELAEQLGRTPTKKDIDEAGKVCIGVYIRRFGGLIKAQKAAGLVPNKFISKQ